MVASIAFELSLRQGTQAGTGGYRSREGKVPRRAVEAQASAKAIESAGTCLRTSRSMQPDRSNELLDRSGPRAGFGGKRGAWRSVGVVPFVAVSHLTNGAHTVQSDRRGRRTMQLGHCDLAGREFAERPFDKTRWLCASDQISQATWQCSCTRCLFFPQP